MKTLLSFTVLFFALCGNTVGQSTTGRDLLEKCQNATNILDSNPPTSDIRELTQRLAKGSFCSGYVSGVLDLIMLAKTADQDNPSKVAGVCAPDSGITNEEAIRVVVKWLMDNPNKLHDSGVEDVIRAMKRAYPCK